MILGDKDDMLTMLEQYREHMDQKINKQDKEITRRIKEEWSGIETKLKQGAHSRNRSIVKEIIETCTDFREKIKEQFEKMKEEIDNE